MNITVSSSPLEEPRKQNTSAMYLVNNNKHWNTLGSLKPIMEMDFSSDQPRVADD